MTGADLDTDLAVDPADARAELLSYRRLIRVLGRPVPQPAPDGRPTVVLVPGFVSGTVSLTPLARALRRAGWRTAGGGVGTNLGCTDHMVARLLRRVVAVGAPVVLVGHSRGGMLAKLAAQRRPDLVAGLVVLAGPVTGELVLTAHVRRQLQGLFRLRAAGMRGVLSRDCVVGGCGARIAAELAGPVPAGLPYTSVFTRHDAIIDWRACLDPAAELVEVASTHGGMGTDPLVARVVVDVLGHQLGRSRWAWRPAASNMPMSSTGPAGAANACGTIVEN